MGEFFPDDSKEKREKKKEADFNKINRLKENLMKLEKGVVSEVDEHTQSMRGAMQAMGFGITPVSDDDDDDTSNDDTAKKPKKNKK